MPKVTPERWAAIRLLALDVDGVLTTGALTFDSNGQLWQTFNVRDGLAMVTARRFGLHIAWISGRPSQPAQQRFEELRLNTCELACPDKAVALRRLQAREGFQPEECCFVGDDLPDLPAFAVCGLAVAVADAVPEVMARAHYITAAAGGRGAVREVIECILGARGEWQQVVQEYEAAGSLPNLQHPSDDDSSA